MKVQRLTIETMIIKVLITYSDPMDNSLPPQIFIREWKEIKVTPQEWYELLAHPYGYTYYRI